MHSYEVRVRTVVLYVKPDEHVRPPSVNGDIGVRHLTPI